MNTTRPIALVTESRYEDLTPGDWYTDNILEEDRLVAEALAARGLYSERVAWSRSDLDWTRYSVALLRTTWDYFERFAEFSAWLDRVSRCTRLLNPGPLVRWNVDKHYFADLEARGVHTVPTVFIEQGSRVSVASLLREHRIEHAVLKPVISGSARHTYRVSQGDAAAHEATLARLLADEAMMVQPFQHDIVERGEMTLVIIDGQFTHALRKVAKAGDFRVQDDHGGTVHPYSPTTEEIEFAQRAVAACEPTPLYGRVDMIRDNDGHLAVMELELVEPELWFRLSPTAADALAAGIEHRMREPTRQS